MKRLALSAMISLLSVLPVFSDGIGMYVPDRNGYIAKDGSSYSVDENTCASGKYALGSILSIKRDDAQEVLVYVNDDTEMPPDRQILVNNKAAEELGITDTGFAEMEVSVVLEGEKLNKPTGWNKFKVATFKTNREALEAYTTLKKNNLKPTAEISEDGPVLYVRYVPQYQVNTIFGTLKGLGYSDPVLLPEINPYS